MSILSGGAFAYGAQRMVEAAYGRLKKVVVAFREDVRESQCPEGTMPVEHARCLVSNIEVALLAEVDAIRVSAIPRP